MKKIIQMDWLKATKKNQLAYITTRKTLVSEKDMPEELQQLCKTHTIEIEHSRYVLLKCDYLKKANAMRVKQGLEPLTKAAALPWGEWEIDGIIIKHNGVQYLRCYLYDGEYQDHDYALYFDGHLHDDLDNTFMMIEAWRHKNKHKPTVCYNVRMDTITELTLCDKDALPETDIIRYEDDDEE